VSEYTGWLLDLYAHQERGLALWLLCDDGQRRCVYQTFPVTFYAAGPSTRLRALWMHLQSLPLRIRLARAERRDLFRGETVVLSACLDEPAELPGLYRQLSEIFPDLNFYDADLHASLRHAAQYGTFPLARVALSLDERDQVQELEVLDSRWELDPEPPPFRIMTLEPDVDPFHARPRRLLIHSPKGTSSYALDDNPALLMLLSLVIKEHDPDLLITSRGDTWLFPLLLEMAKEKGCELPFNRDPDKPMTQKAERSYFAYNQVIYRGRQFHLAGRLHIDAENTVMYHDYGLHGVMEMARVTSLPIQTAARVSPGTGISAMQIVTALKQEILVPQRKEQVEKPKTTSELFQADMGGMIYDPIVGLHEDVAEVDFVSMYPSIMVHFNVSPETVGSERPTAEVVPELDMIVDRKRPGLIPQTLGPLLEKRIRLKQTLLRLSKWDCRTKGYKAQAAAHKWLLVTCFGYLGYRNARFGRIEAHEAVTAYGREILLRAKEAAEDRGYRVLHMYVDGLWVQKAGHATPEQVQPLLDDILTRTGLPILLDGIYKWVAFLPSRMDARIAVPNRYFGVFQDGEIKTRGIETRRHDTPVFIAETQMQILECLAKGQLPEAQALLRRRLVELKAGKVSPEKLIVRMTVSRTLEKFRAPSPTAVALRQLEEAGKSLRPGQHVRLVYTRGKVRARAWDLPEEMDARTVDVERYARLLLRAARAVLEPFVAASADPLCLYEAPSPNAGHAPHLPLLGASRDEERQLRLW
jgi:DNA polymerase-2